MKSFSESYRNAASSLVSLFVTATTASNCHSNDHQSRHEKN